MDIHTSHNGKEGRLTTEHASSSYGIPVLVMDGQAYGPADLLPYWPEMAMAAAEYVAGWAETEGPDAVEMARQWGWAGTPTS